MATATAEIEIVAREFELYDEGTYLAQVVDVEKTKGNYGEQLKWKLDFPDIEREDGEPAYLSYYTDLGASIKNKLGRMLTACRLAIPGPGESLKAKLVIGQWLQAKIAHKMRADGTVGCIVSEFLPITPKQRKQLQAQFALPADDAADAPEETPSPAATSNAHAAANTAGEDAKASAVAEVRPILMMLMDALTAKEQKLSKENAGPGLLALGTAAKAQKVKLPEISFDLVSLNSIQLAKEEALALIETLTADAADPFADGE